MVDQCELVFQLQVQCESISQVSDQTSAVSCYAILHRFGSLVRRPSRLVFIAGVAMVKCSVFIWHYPLHRRCVRVGESVSARDAYWLRVIQEL